MINYIDRRLNEFVDRKAEMEVFDNLLARSTEESIAVLWGESWTGKSSLLQRMMKAAEEAAAQSRPLRSVYVNWLPTTSWDYLEFMREVRRQLGVEHFQAFTAAVSLHFTRDHRVSIDINAPGISILQDATVSGEIQKVVGVQIQDLGILVPRGDLAVDEIDRVRGITSAFLEDLGRLADSQTILFFLDTFENASKNTISWLWDYVLTPVRAGRIGNLLFVVSGQHSPPTHEDWDRDIIAIALPPLEAADIDEYLQRRGLVSPEQRAIAVPLLLDLTKGRAGEVARQVDSLLRKLGKAVSP